MSTSKDIINYTDFHDVDEDIRTIILHGAAWSYHSTAGIVFRYLNDTPAGDNASVASSTVEFLNYTDGHDVDEDLRTIQAQGGYWDNGVAVGVILRLVFDLSSAAYDTVASRRNITQHDN